MTYESSIKTKSRPAQARHYGLVAAALMIAALTAAPALAHKTFLAPLQNDWAIGSTVEIALTSGLAFPDIEHGTTQDRIAFISVQTGNQAVSEITYQENDTSLNLSFPAQRAGLAVVGISTLPRFGEIAPDDADSYLDEIGADADVHRAFADLPGSPALNRSYIKHTKTFLCIASCDTGQEASYTPLGQALEFVAVADHGRTFQLVRNGTALAGQQVEAYSDQGQHQQAVTDQNGRVELDGTLSGLILLSAIWITLPKQADGVYHSDQATLTVTLEPVG